MRNLFRGKSFPNGASDKLRIDYAEAVKFQLSPERFGDHSSPERRNSSRDERESAGDRRTPPSHSSRSPSKSSTSSRHHGDQYTEARVSASSSGASLNKSMADEQSNGGRAVKKLKSFEASPTSKLDQEPVKSDQEKKADDSAILADLKKPLSKNAFENIIITTTNDSRRVDTMPLTSPTVAKRLGNGNTPAAAAAEASSSAEKRPAPKNELEPATKEFKRSNSLDSKKPSTENSASAVHDHLPDEAEAERNDSPSQVSKSPSSTARASPVSNDDPACEDTSSPNLHHFNLGDEPFINSQLLHANLSSVEPIRELCDPCWSGIFVLKKNAFPTKFYLLSGNRELASKYLPINETPANSSSLLRISQRLRLDSTKIDELERLLNQSCSLRLPQAATSSTELTFSVLIALPTELPNSSPQLQQQIEQNQLQHRSIHYLIQYLNEKTAAGVIPLNDERDSLVLHAFTPNCQFSARILKQILPGLKSSGLDSDIASSSSSPSESGQSNDSSNEYLIIVILKP